MAKTGANKKPTVIIIGPGRLGMALALALNRSHYKIGALVGRRKGAALKVSNLLDAQVQTLAIKEIKNLKVPELIIVSTPDDEIPKVAKLLSKLRPERNPTVVLHTSGALSSGVLSALAKPKWSIGSIHPLVSVSDPVEGAKLLQGAFWCLEGDSRAKRMSDRIVRDLKGQSFFVSADSKPLYHAAAVMSAGNVVALFDVAVEMLRRCGVSENQARRVLLPLLSSTATNLARQKPVKALTGTFARGDIATMKLHLKALTKENLPEALALYRLLGRRSLKLAKQNGLADDVVEKMRAEVSDGPVEK